MPAPNSGLEDGARMQPPVEAVYKALLKRLANLQANAAHMSAEDQHEALFEMYRINHLLSLKDVNKNKCKEKYLVSYHAAVAENLPHLFNIQPYVEHFARLQLNLCREFFHENLAEVIESLADSQRDQVELLRVEVEAAGCAPQMGSMIDGIYMDRSNLIQGAGSFMVKTMASSSQSFTKLCDFFDCQIKNLTSLCELFEQKMEHLMHQFDGFNQGEIERIADDDIKWVSAARICQNVNFYAVDREAFEEAFNSEAVARPKAQ